MLYWRGRSEFSAPVVSVGVYSCKYVSPAIQYFNALNYPILASSFNGKYQTINLDFVLLIMFLFVNLANVHKTHGPSWTLVDHGVCEHGLRLQSRSRAH